MSTKEANKLPIGSIVVVTDKQLYGHDFEVGDVVKLIERSMTEYGYSMHKFRRESDGLEMTMIDEDYEPIMKLTTVTQKELDKSRSKAYKSLIP